MAVLVTGGAGFVGSHLVDACVAKGNRVVVLDDFSTGSRANLAAALASGQVTLFEFDVAAPPQDVERLLAGEAISAIFHLASPASPDAYGTRPWATLAVNALGTMSLVEFALARGATMLFASTSEVYGDPLVHPQPESYFGNVNPVGPRACYDEGKRFGEAAMSVAIRERGLDGRIVRIFNCYGPRMALGDGRLVPALLDAATRNVPFLMHGTGRQTRSMTYVDDIVDGLLRVTAWSPAGVVPVNLGSEEETTVAAVAATFFKVAGVKPEVRFAPGRPEDPARRRPSTDLARSIGWSARVSLEDGLRRTYAWHRDRMTQLA